MASILIVDDSELIRCSLKKIFSENPDWTVCGEAANGQEALVLAQQRKPDLIVLDIGMPVMDGLQAAREILKLTPEVPIVLYTLHKTKEIEWEGEKVGARRVLAKSDNSDVLVQCLKEVLNECRPSGALVPVDAGSFSGVDSEGNPESQVSNSTAKAGGSPGKTP